MTSRARADWQHWSALFLFGLQASLLLLIFAWALRTCAPIEPAATIVPSEKPVSAVAALEATLENMRTAERELTAQLASARSEIARKANACTPALPADRWNSKDLRMLEGCWVLGQEGRAVRGEPGTPNIEDCTISAGKICFDANGQGQRESRSVCPVAGSYECKAAVTARFNDDGTFITTQVDTLCSPPKTNWVARTLSCRRIDDSSASCVDSSRMGTFTYEFKRER